MTIDITALAGLVGRLDVSAALRSFTVVMAFIFVILNLTVIYLGVGELLVWDFEEASTTVVFIAFLLTAVIAAFGPLVFLFWDWAARKPWRHISAVSGALMGGFGFAFVGGIIGGLVFMIQQEEPLDSEWWKLLPLTIPMVFILAGLCGWLFSQSKQYRLFFIGINVGVLGLAVAGLVGYFLLVIGEGDDLFVESSPFLVVAALAIVAFVSWLFIRAIRHRILLSADRPRELLLGALHNKGFWARLSFLAGLPSSLWRPSALMTPAFWAFIVSWPMVYAGFLLVQRDEFRGLGVGITVVIGLTLIAGGHAMFYLGKRLAARSAWVPENPSDKRAPILFLRSFNNDQLKFKRKWWDIFGRWIDIWSFRRNADEAMIDEIAQYGPVVALGVPGEKKVPFGARRYYSSHDAWQDIVARTAKSAEAVVVGAGDSPSLKWEYEMLASEGLLDRTILLFPPGLTDSGANQAALAIFLETTKIDIDFDIPKDRDMIALLKGEAGYGLLTAADATASAYILALRAHFQKPSASQLADSLEFE